MGAVIDPAKTLKSITQRDRSPAVTLIISPDRIRRERTIDHLLLKFAPSNQQDCITRLKSEELTEQRVRSLSDDILTISLFNPIRFYVISDIENANQTIIDKLLVIIQKLDTSCKLIFSATKLPQSHALYKIAKKDEALLALEELKGFELRRWCERELKFYGIKEYEDRVPDCIIDISEHNPNEISQNIAQLALYINNQKLTVNDVTELFIKAPDPNEFALLDLITTGSRAKSEILISQLIQSGKSPFALLGLLARNFTNYLLIAHYIEKTAQRSEIREKLGLSPWILNKALPVAERYGVRKLRRCLRAVLIADSKLKNRSLGTEIIFSELASRISI